MAIRWDAVKALANWGWRLPDEEDDFVCLESTCFLLTRLFKPPAAYFPTAPPPENFCSSEGNPISIAQKISQLPITIRVLNLGMKIYSICFQLNWRNHNWIWHEKNHSCAYICCEIWWCILKVISVYHRWFIECGHVCGSDTHTWTSYPFVCLHNPSGVGKIFLKLQKSIERIALHRIKWFFI